MSTNDTPYMLTTGGQTFAASRLHKGIEERINRAECERRINAFDGLVEALKHITKPVDKGDCCHDAFMKGDTEFENHLFDVAMEALIAAGVKE